MEIQRKTRKWKVTTNPKSVKHVPSPGFPIKNVGNDRACQARAQSAPAALDSRLKTAGMTESIKHVSQSAPSALR